MIKILTKKAVVGKGPVKGGDQTKLQKLMSKLAQTK